MTLKTLLTSKRYADLMYQICSDDFVRVNIYAYTQVAELHHPVDIFPSDVPEKYLDRQVDLIGLDYEDQLVEIQLEWTNEDLREAK